MTALTHLINIALEGHPPERHAQIKWLGQQVSNEMEQLRTHTHRVTTNFIDKYGEDRLRWMLGEFQKETPASVIAKELGVSRARVGQWRDAMGHTIRIYDVPWDVKAMAEMEPNS